MSSRSGGQVLVDALVDHAVTDVWGIPGTHNLEIYRHLADRPVRHLLPRHEQGAAFAADGYARAGRRPGVCVTTSGPAVLNAATALAQSWSDSVPVLLVSAGMPLRHPGRGNGTLHETKDLTAALNGIVAYSHRVTSVDEIPSAVAQAFATMADGRARPVHLEVPYDVLEERGDPAPALPVPPAARRPDPRAVAEVVEILSAARAPLLVTGGGARDAGEPLRALAERLVAPVVSSINGKGGLPEHHALALGAGLHRAPVAEVVQDSDVVLVVGCELAPADLWEGPLQLAGKVARLDVDPHQIYANATPRAAVLGDSAATLALLAEQVRPPEQEDLPSRRNRADRWRQIFHDEARATSDPWRHVLEPIAAGLGPDGLLVGDSAQICYLGAVAAVPAAGTGRLLYPTGYGTLGYAVPAAFGAKVARPRERVLALVGDGGLMFTLSELAAAAAAGVGFPVVVADNQGYGEIRDEMVDRCQSALGVDIDTPDLVGAAVALGCAAFSCAGEEELAARLEDAFDQDRPTLLVVSVP